MQVTLQAANDIQWFRIELPAVTADSGFVDIRSEYPHGPINGDPPYGDLWLGLPDMRVFRSDGGQIDSNYGFSSEFSQIALSWGLTDPRPPQCAYVDTGYGLHFACGPNFNGFDGNLTADVYWLAVGQGYLLTPAQPFGVHSPVAPNANTERLTTLVFTIQPAGVPYCDGDMNWDGVADQGDIDYLINVVAGGENSTRRDADFNHDGVVDQGDVDALINVVAGGECP
ncbi:MAG: hypothetical protein GC200_10235 [Tepidisphaera sp.]|nr:hypothetical protein [Tepidisphaera sp.]